MQTRPRRIVPLRPPAAVTAPAPAPAPDRTRADSETHARLQAMFASFYNALFDAACLANDEQRHARTIQLLRAVKAQEHVIIEGICADIARPGAPAGRPVPPSSGIRCSSSPTARSGVVASSIRLAICSDVAR